KLALPMAWRFLLVHLRQVTVTALDLRLRLELATVQASPGYGTIFDLSPYFLLFRETAKVGSLAPDLYPAMATGFRRVSIAVFFAAAEVAASVSVSDAVSIARFSFSLPPSWLSPLHSSDSVAKWIRNAKPHRSDPLV